MKLLFLLCMVIPLLAAESVVGHCLIAGNQLEVRLKQSGHATITLLAPTGEELLSRSGSALADAVVQLPLPANLPRGVYQIRMQQGLNQQQRMLPYQ